MTKGLRNPLLVWNKPVNPSTDRDFHKRSTKPVTLKDLGGTYLTAGMRNFERKGNSIDLIKLRQDLDQWHNPALKPGESSNNLLTHNFGKVIWLNITFLKAYNWKEAIEEIKKRKLYIFDCWGTVPGCKSGKEGGLSWVIPDDTHNYLTKRLGKYFISWNNGENDGRWFWQSMRICPVPISRRESYQYFLGWFKPFIADLKNYATALCGLTYPHYFAKMDSHRMIGAEFIQGLPSVPMWAAWVRGAARQYQMLWMAGISIFNMFGYKSFEEDKFNDLNLWTGIDVGKGNPNAQGGPDRGPSIHLIKRVWYTLFMYGVNIEALETSQFFRPAGPSQPSIPSVDKEIERDIAPKAKREYLSPLGKMQLKATSFCVKNEKRRGVQYCPLGVLLNFYSGWAPPRHLYSDSFYTVWGGIPYEKGDHQIDLFFREIFPGYQDCPYFRNEYGFLIPTPYGDIVDVLLSDVRDDILSRYQAISVLGEIFVKDELLTKLTNYVKRGGNVIWSLSQLNNKAMKLSGIISMGKDIKANESRNIANGKRYKEHPFVFPEVSISGAKVLLKGEDSQPLMVSKNFGKGRIITIIVPFGLTGRIKEPHPLIGADPARDTTTIYYFDKSLGSPYRFLEGVKEILFTYLCSFNLVEVLAFKDPVENNNVGRPVFIQYITNLTDKPDKLIVTLINNEPFPVYLLLKTKRAKIKKAIDLLHDEKEMSITNDTLYLTLFPCDSADFNIYIVELKIDKPIVKFIERKRNYGY